MVKCSALLLLVTAAVVAEPPRNSTALKKPRQISDSDGSGTDFFPQYSGFPTFPVHSPGALPHDLTALQQTHVLGDFHHRFQQQRFGPPQFQNQPLLFSQQTEFGGENSFNNQRAPPQHVLPPPQEQPPPVVFPQSNQFRPLSPAAPKPPTFPPQNQFPETRPAFGDQRNQFSEPPPQQNFVEPPQIPFQNQPNNFQSPSFRQQQTFQSQPINSSPSFSSQQTLNGPTPLLQDSNVRNPSQSFFEENIRSPQRNNQFFPRNPSNPSNFDQTLRSPPQNPPFVPNQRNPSFLAQPPSNSQTLPPPTNHFINQPSSNFQNNSPQPQFPPQPTSQFQTVDNNPLRFNNDNFPTRPNFQQSSPNFNQPQFELPLNPPFSQNFKQSFPPTKDDEPPVSFNPNRKPVFLPTQIPKTNEETTAQYNINVVHSPAPSHKNADVPPKRPLLPLIPSEIPNFNEPSDTKDFQLQKSEEQSYFPQYNTQPIVNEISSATSRSVDSTNPVRSKTQKPTVQEITINLATTPVPEKREKSSRKEKTQEEIINEQIQKLLNSHNLELVNKETKQEGAEPPLPELPPHLKDKYQIKLVNSDVLSELKGSKKKKEKQEVSTLPPLPPLPDLPDHIKKQYDIKLVQKDELFKQFKIGSGGKLVANSDLVSPLPGKANANESTVFLANGQQLEIVRFPKGDVKDSLAKSTTIASTTTTTTSKPPNELFQELAKGVIPPGANFELIKHNGNGEVEKVNDLTAAKKVTFVLLEEQPDGTVKVQGVKGNSNPEKTEKESVDSLIKKIKDGSLKLPPSESILTNEIPRPTTTQHKTFVTLSPYTEKESEGYTTEVFPSSEATFLPTLNPYGEETPSAFTTPATNEVPETTFLPTVQTYLTSKKPKSKSRPSFLPTSGYNVESSTYSSRRHKSSKRPLRRKPTTTTTAQYEYEDEDYNHRSSNYNGEGPIPQDVVGEESNIQPSPSLTSTLQNYGLYEMAKFLDQSGLDTILNETGPYTIFIPTDAAFANLQEQLGGMDKAEDKFRENPRLLSGLLLHHVVPGSFKVEDLQDEMTGVSLAGTQLRVNTYNSERKNSVVTINGAVIAESKSNIPVPQGIAHAVDRVLFPLPVGDILQTLKGDRERRFSKFVKSIEASGLENMLTGSKTYTVFAPTDKAFAALTDSELDKLLTRREAARTIVLRHVMPGTLYSAGMHFYQIKESMERGQKITIQKELGKVKANSVPIQTTNIPATNGVIHVLETLL